jgi:hypothetical protein
MNVLQDSDKRKKKTLSLAYDLYKYYLQYLSLFEDYLRNMIGPNVDTSTSAPFFAELIKEAEPSEEAYKNFLNEVCAYIFVN